MQPPLWLDGTANVRRQGTTEDRPVDRLERVPLAHSLCGGCVMRAEAGNRRDWVRELLADLKIPGDLEAVDGILAQADSGAMSAAEAIECRARW